MKKPKQAAQAPAPQSDDPMQAYAMRIWNGQSVSLPIAERVRRVEVALIEQGMDHAGLQLPVSTL